MSIPSIDVPSASSMVGTGVCDVTMAAASTIIAAITLGRVGERIDAEQHTCWTALLVAGHDEFCEGSQNRKPVAVVATGADW